MNVGGDTALKKPLQARGSVFDLSLLLLDSSESEERCRGCEWLAGTLQRSLWLIQGARK